MQPQSFLVDINNFEYQASSKPTKLGGSREEHILYNTRLKTNKPLTQALINISNEIKSKNAELANMDMTYASVIIAKKNSPPKDLEVHTDSKDENQIFIRSMTYLTDVPENSNGPIVFQNPVLGPKGTTVLYGSNVPHGGLVNTSNIDRIGLTIIFTNKTTNGRVRSLIGDHGGMFLQCSHISFLRNE
jgi:hypothetical protein